MKTDYIVIILLFTVFTTKAQEQNSISTSPFEKKNELKLNVLFTPLGLLDLAYERNLNRKSSLGISGLYVFSQKHDEDTNFLISPFYRRYFGKKYASGFFVEGFTTVGSTDGKQLADINGNLTLNEGPDVIDLSLGLTLGSKWITKQGIVFEAFFGFGKTLFNTDKTDHSQVNRFGINVGYRF
ncbi:DUF3575 domain-containing protein [Zobellia sp. 1_MG-2023]|uniref:DUF3575 domain-containing protein n=1 Tax=Zobellia sp. 1_MG-2023 TaxID=3062626 RepID=UPI0026E1C246|nr:DUF3575 domain-containing protein [Zobellia sp. 1_MG-2023]MDO6821362.1 DUF3575 domain-containing protein [Zobellia sp. 1_MG-2023]